MAAYSSTPLPKKLGIKESSRIKLIAAPKHFIDLLLPIPPTVRISSKLRKDIDIVHAFVHKKHGLKELLKSAMQQIKQEGMIWISWPKKSSGVKSDMSEDEIRHAALPLGLVDVKVCSIDEVWSGLKLVIRKELRK